MKPEYVAGQRVRIKDMPRISHPELVGEITTVVECVGVNPDTGRIRYRILRPGEWYADEDVLEPIDDGRELGSWSELAGIWTPSGIRA